MLNPKAKSTSTIGEQMVRELEWVHGMLRRDLGAVRLLADRVTDGAEAAEVRDGLIGLQTRGPLWQLRMGCLHYCQFVHGHHGLEDAALFPLVRANNPELAEAVAKLEADHRVVSDLLDAVEAEARRLGDADGDRGDDDARAALAAALDLLADTLLEHLAYEESTIGPAMRQWRTRPW